jgi:hypothetical protein
MRRLYRILLLVPVLLVLMAAPGSANAPPQIETFEDQFTDVNPCTGEEHTIFLTGTARVHGFEVETAERHHSTVHISVDIQTSDGYSGTVVATEIGLGEEEEGTGMFASMGNGVITNPDTGERFRTHFNAHFVQVGGVPKVDSFVFVLECLGV